MTFDQLLDETIQAVADGKDVDWDRYINLVRLQEVKIGHEFVKAHLADQANFERRIAGQYLGAEWVADNLTDSNAAT